MDRPGTITQLSPQDGLGWITLDDGEQVRFGGTACRGVTIEVGRRVRVLGTAPGYGGTVKATAVVPFEPPAAQPVRKVAARSDLAKLDALGIAVEDGLRAIVARADRDDAFFLDLERLGFELAPMLADELDCRASAFFVIAMDGSGSAFGVYMAPDAPSGPPWIYWEHEDDTLHFVAEDTARFFTCLLDDRARSMKDPAPAERTRAALRELGVPVGDRATPTGYFLDGKPATWLPVLRR